MAPPKYRGMLNLFFQWCTTIGIIAAQLINYGTETYYKDGWRVSLAIAAVPGFMILLGGIFLPESPSFLLSQNRYEEGRRVNPMLNSPCHFPDTPRLYSPAQTLSTYFQSTERLPTLTQH